MHVILLKEVKNVGRPGELKQVSDGFARNFLLPNKLATIATQEERKLATQRQAKHAKAAVKKQRVIVESAKKLDGLTLEIVRKTSDDGTLYAGVHEQDIVDALANKGVVLDAGMIQMDSALKKLGDYTVKVVVQDKEYVVPLTIRS